MAGLGGLGYFAGGLATGVLAGRRNAREEERARRDEEEYQRQGNVRRAAGNTLGNIGQTNEDGSVYSAEQGYQDYGRQVAQYDPERSANARVQGIGLQKARREENTAQLGEYTLAARRRLHAGEDPVALLQEAIPHYNSKINDGKHAGVADVNGVPHISVIESATGRAALKPIDASVADQVLQHMYDLSSVPAHEKSLDRGQKDRELKVKEGELGVHRSLGAAHEEYYRGLARRGFRTGADELHQYQLQQQKAFDQNKAIVLDKLQRGVIDEKEAGSQLRMLSVKFGSASSLNEPRGAPPAKQGLQAIGQTGLLQDTEGNVFRMDDRSGGLVPVSTPQSLQKLGEGIVKNLSGRGAQGDATGTAPRGLIQEPPGSYAEPTEEELAQAQQPATGAGLRRNPWAERSRLQGVMRESQRNPAVY